MKRRAKVDLRKRHPFDKEMKQAIAIGWFGVLVELAAVGEMIYFHQYQSMFTMVVAVLLLVGALHLLYRTRSAYPLSLWDAWLLRRVRRHRSSKPRQPAI